jgi:hypothetical protein
MQCHGMCNAQPDNANDFVCYDRSNKPQDHGPSEQIYYVPPPIDMSDNSAFDDDDDDDDDDGSDDGAHNDDSCLLSTDSFEYQELKRLKKMQRMRAKSAETCISSSSVHYGFQVYAATFPLMHLKWSYLLVTRCISAMAVRVSRSLGRAGNASSARRWTCAAHVSRASSPMPHTTSRMCWSKSSYPNTRTLTTSKTFRITTSTHRWTWSTTTWIRRTCQCRWQSMRNVYFESVWNSH